VQRIDGLPEGFVLAKPIAQESYDQAVIKELEEQGRLIITRKRDGWKILALCCSNGDIRLYTAGGNEIDSRLDHIKHALQVVLTPGTLIAGEAVMGDDNDDLAQVQRVFKLGSPDRAIELQRKIGQLHFMMFGMVDLAQNDERGLPYHEVLDRFDEYFDSGVDYNYVDDPIVCNVPFSKAEILVRDGGWEGLVLYARDYRMTFRLDGKSPKRPKGCYKWKPIMEDDFVVRETVKRPKDPATVKDLVLLQIDPVTREEFACGKIGAFNADMRSFFSNKARYPLVVQVRFDGRHKSGKVRDARFMRIRDDKPIHECIAPRSFVKK
jgi:ATP-dependent DNA ligase